LVAPLEVRPFPVHEKEPQFCAEEGWLESCVVAMRRWIEAEEERPDRVRPTAFIRCSRGGKTRALKELNKELLAKLDSTAVVYISFNDFAALHEWELRDPVGAICRRIAFAALKQRDDTAAGFDRFRETRVTESDIGEWLGKTPCVLLIDELNVLELDATGGRLVAKFLKGLFLFTRGRYFAFSSHVVPTARGLADFLDSISERGVDILELPLIPSLAEAREKLDWPALTVTQALFRARVPALIWYTRGANPPPFDKRRAAIAEVLHSWTDTNVKQLLLSFFNGLSSFAPQPLLQLMNALPVDAKIAWVPFHMVHVLESIAGNLSVSEPVRNAVCTIQETFLDFERGKTSGCDSWEALFVIALMIRLVAGSFHDSLLPLDADLPACTVSFNLLWREQEDMVTLPDIMALAQLMKGLTKPWAYPHAAVYYPPHARFETYDVILVVHKSEDVRVVYGYQLKEGRVIPAQEADEICDISFVVRGFAAAKETLRRGWRVASDENIDGLLGVTGSMLAPKKWREMRSGGGNA
jgi:hypothetical protein